MYFTLYPYDRRLPPIAFEADSTGAAFYRALGNADVQDYDTENLEVAQAREAEALFVRLVPFDPFDRPEAWFAALSRISDALQYDNDSKVRRILVPLYALADTNGEEVVYTLDGYRAETAEVFVLSDSDVEARTERELPRLPERHYFDKAKATAALAKRGWREFAINNDYLLREFRDNRFGRTTVSCSPATAKELQKAMRRKRLPKFLLERAAIASDISNFQDEVLIAPLSDLPELMLGIKDAPLAFEGFIDRDRQWADAERLAMRDTNFVEIGDDRYYYRYVPRYDEDPDDDERF